MSKKWKKIIASILSVCCLPMMFAGCKKTNNISYDFDKSGFYGLCEVFGEMGGGLDPGITNEWIADMAGALGTKSFRMWISFGDLYPVDEDDVVVPNRAKIALVRDAVDRLKAAGVKDFLAMSTAFVYPKDYPVTTGYVVPDPYEEYDMYLRFMEVQQKAYIEFVKDFPEVEYFEPANEPEMKSCIHKNGYTHGGTDLVNASYIYTQYDQVRILADLCWYTTKAVQSVNPNAKVMNPSLCGLTTTPDYLNDIYEAIESGALPAGQEKSDTDPDNYFQVLNWHPYTFGSDTVTDAWLQLQQETYQVAIDHDDGGKPVWFTEFGWTDWGEPTRQQTIADAYVGFFDMVKAEMPWVQTVMIFRLTTLATQDISLGENNFGIMYNKDDPLYGGQPKAAALAIAKYSRGENADLSGLYKYVKD
ncbi:MAG: hypothetical protein E7371_05185 [Clostridiales bacterium]|nr:hypothetical protein [Clostridiales bacterium]